jgi:hypothetical protein
VLRSGLAELGRNELNFVAGALATEPTVLDGKGTEGIAVGGVLGFGLAELGRNELSFVAGAESRRADCDVVGPREARAETLTLRGVDPRASTCT